ncbi:DEAD/DEAH box helicase [Photobacterium phosphoreum]|uniref:DEAD/DEAH box helicase n=1 Tax=Photobacterium phosphoreum TaxID=659 RepID=UPI0039B0DD6A
MELISSITVCGHAVQTSLNGMSEFQNQLLNDPSLVRMAEAPAGCGKSYAFLRAVLNGDRVLFVVPTRRLAMNLISTLQYDMRAEGWNDVKINNKISLWSSDGRETMKANGVKNVTQKRLFELSELSPLTGGEIVVTTPESLAWLTLDPERSPIKGVSDRSVLDIVQNFNHIVFDEMHTIEKRGLTLSLIVSWLCVQFPQWNSKLSYLSATPIDLTKVFDSFGFKSTDITYISENVTDIDESDSRSGRRVIHGDVKINCYKDTTLSELIIINKDYVLSEISADRQIILIYDQLFDGLSKALPELAHALNVLGLKTYQSLLISSVDDSQKGNASYLGFANGSDKDPKNYPILIATSSIEIGVTFNCRLMFMEPGYSSSSMVQRIGRVSRGDFDGSIFMSLKKECLARHIWLKRFEHWVRKHHEHKVSIRDLTDLLSEDLPIKACSPESSLRSTRRRSAPSYGSMSSQAAAIAGLYWFYAERHIGLQKARKELLHGKMPAIANKMSHLLSIIKRLSNDIEYEDASKNWLTLFEKEVKTLRSIPKTVKVRSTYTDASWKIPRDSLLRDTILLDKYDLIENSKGEMELWIDDPHWRNGLTDDRRSVKSVESLCLPHTVERFPSKKFDLQKNMLSIIDNVLSDEFQPENVIVALEAVRSLALMTGLICIDE